MTSGRTAGVSGTRDQKRFLTPFTYTKADTGGGLNDEWNHTRTHNGENEITAMNQTTGNWAVPVYNEHGNMKSGPQGDAVGTNLKFVYDAWARLVEVKDNADNRLAQYRYDGLHRRVRKMTPDTGNDWDVTEYYYNAGWQLLEVRTGTHERLGSPPAEPDTVSTVHEQYVWSLRYVDAAVLRDRDADGNAGTGDYGKSGSGLEERLYYLTDANMNVTTLTDTSGDAVERTLYDPYGKPTFMDGSWTNGGGASARANAVTFAGYFFDTESGLYHVRNRMYHPTLGRWMQRDPAGYVDGMNLYEYAGGNAPGRVDPSGRWFGVAVFAFAVAAVVVIVAASVHELTKETVAKIDHASTRIAFNGSTKQSKELRKRFMAANRQLQRLRKPLRPGITPSDAADDMKRAMDYGGLYANPEGTEWGTTVGGITTLSMHPDLNVADLIMLQFGEWQRRPEGGKGHYRNEREMDCDLKALEKLLRHSRLVPTKHWRHLKDSP